MPRAAKLKVYRTPIGFHDAYVAAPSQKAALQAWGSDADLFARGVAEQVADPALMEEPLAHPGKVIRRLRGSAEEQLAALPAESPAPKPPFQFCTKLTRRFIFWTDRLAFFASPGHDGHARVPK